jgi:hypothetical protein
MAQTLIPETPQNRVAEPLVTSSWQRILIGMLGGVAALCTKFLAHDYSVIATYIIEHRNTDAANLGIGYIILGPILVFLGGLLAWVAAGETSRMKILAIGIAAPALITTAAGTGGTHENQKTTFQVPIKEFLLAPALAKSEEEKPLQTAQNIGQGIQSFFGVAEPAKPMISGQSVAVTSEINTDRPGGDYYNTATPDLASCQALCQRDTKCKAYTFLLPGSRPNNWHGPPPPHCWLKNVAPKPAPYTGFISGVIE